MEYATESPYDILVRLDSPGPGIAAIGVAGYPGHGSSAAMNFYMYGDQAAATIAREAPKWQAWMQQRFPAPQA